MVWLTDEKRLALFSAGTIVRDPHHRRSSARREQDLNLSSGFDEWGCVVMITTTPQCQIFKMIELCCGYLSVPCIWLNVLIMSRTRFRVNLHSVVSWMNINELLARNRCNICSLSDCNGIRTHYHLVRNRILNHLAKLAINTLKTINTSELPLMLFASISNSFRINFTFATNH